MAIATINPATGETLRTYTPLNESEIETKLALAQTTYEHYRHTTFPQRSQWLNQTANILEQNKLKYAQTMTTEMGKTLKSAIAEVEKCALVCRFYADKAPGFLADVPIASDASLSYVAYQPLGAILAVMPWNFPFWQVFRFAAPALMAGNVGLLKHASNVPQCALAIADILAQAGFPEGAFQTLLIGANQVKSVMEDDRIKAATLTGSEPAGAALASTAGQQIKKVVLELGGSDPFIVLASADIEEAVKVAVKSRMLNNGQSCIAAKRFIVEESIADNFQAQLISHFEALVIGDPMAEITDIGPLATASILSELEQQVNKAVQAGGKILLGGQSITDRPGNFFPPTILGNIPTDSDTAQEEFFGPVALLFRVENIDEAIALANKNRLVKEIGAGAVFINGMVKSDPRLPFGGIKRSGYGRELGSHGLHEFVNIKTVWIK